MQHMNRLGLVWIMAVMFLLVSCSSDKTTVPEDKCPGRTTPENLILTLACAYHARDIDAYADLLHEDFIFEFIPDIADSLGLPPDSPWWGRTADVAATKALFEDSTVTGISFSYEIIGDWFACEDVRADTTFTGLCCRLDPLIEVLVQSAGVDTIFSVNESWLDITLAYESYTEGLWVMLRMEEHMKQTLACSPLTTFATRPSSLSGIKALWAPTRPALPFRSGRWLP